jgi:hypothetical protein
MLANDKTVILKYFFICGKKVVQDRNNLVKNKFIQARKYFCTDISFAHIFTKGVKSI